MRLRPVLAGSGQAGAGRIRPTFAVPSSEHISCYLNADLATLTWSQVDDPLSLTINAPVYKGMRRAGLGGSMPKKMALFAALGCLLTIPFGQSSEARVVRFVVEQTRSFADGMSFGDVGQYQRLDGTAYMEFDPRDPLNAVIV